MNILMLIAFAKQNRVFALGLIIVTIWILLAVFAPLIAPYSPTKPHPNAILEPPSIRFLMGTDGNGMDILSRVIWAPRVDLGIAISVTLLSISIGIPLGAFTGYFAGRAGFFGLVAELLMRVVDTLVSFPVFILALALVAVLGPSQRNVIIALTFLNTPSFIRLTRSEALSVREKTFIEAARCSGNNELRIMFYHILPNSLASPLTQFSVCLGFAILATAGLSFVGAGVPVPTPEWGSMVAEGARNMITGQWWPSLFPGLALGSSVFGFGLVSNGIRVFIDPRQRREAERVSRSSI